MRNLVVFFMVFIIFQQAAFANAKSQLEKVNNGSFYNTSSKQSLPDVKTIHQEKAVIDNKSVSGTKDLQSNKNTKNSEKQDVKTEKPSKMTNYQYDETNYHYDKVKKYIQNNLDYSTSGKMKY